ncbi:MAG: universal stress protein [Desulfobacterales bacterium]|uniref:Universal stress protein n=1 Tax=Candidatus Desulfatibia profunda TaxID=2841695 RepID=A0A8J6THH9_9BACT|nr:universal stress protein [Candidatus Desulfatibia profunda]MBL7180234.1 universal stress protein [Desulfobacterales bacterium]
MFRKILFATCLREACDHAARTAFDIAQRYNAHLYVFNVFGVPTHGYSQVVTDLITGDEVMLNEDYVDWVKEEIVGYCDQMLKKTQKYSFEITIGFPHREILRFARHIGPDIIIMGGSTGDPDVSAYKKSMTGSTIQRVAKAAQCPVLVVSRPPASFWGGFSNVVFATDFSTAADAAFAFASRLVREQELDCEFHLFHAIDVAGMPVNQSETQEDIENQIQKARERIRGKYVSRMGDFEKYSLEVRQGTSFVEIAKYAGEKHADMIVLAPHAKKTETGDAMLGSSFEQVIARVNCPVVSVNRFAGK